MFDRLKHRVLADALLAAEHEGVVDLVGGLLHAMRAPADDVGGVLRAIEPVDMMQPAVGIAGNRLRHRRPIQVEDAAAFALEPAAMRDQAVLDLRRPARRPGHLLDGAIPVDPRVRALEFLLPSSSRTGCPALLTIGTGRSFASTLLPGQISPVGAKMY